MSNDVTGRVTINYGKSTGSLDGMRGKRRVCACVCARPSWPNDPPRIQNGALIRRYQILERHGRFPGANFSMHSSPELLIFHAAISRLSTTGLETPMASSGITSVRRDACRDRGASSSWKLVTSSTAARPACTPSHVVTSHRRKPHAVAFRVCTPRFNHRRLEQFTVSLPTVVPFPCSSPKLVARLTECQGKWVRRNRPHEYAPEDNQHHLRRLPVHVRDVGINETGKHAKVEKRQQHILLAARTVGDCPI